MNEPVGGKTVYLWMAQLEKGLVQLTDTANAYRLFANANFRLPGPAGWAITGGTLEQSVSILFSYLVTPRHMETQNT
jgi:hypothetical protein